MFGSSAVRVRGISPTGAWMPKDVGHESRCKSKFDDLVFILGVILFVQPEVKELLVCDNELVSARASPQFVVVPVCVGGLRFAVLGSICLGHRNWSDRVRIPVLVLDQPSSHDRKTSIRARKQTMPQRRPTKVRVVDSSIGDWAISRCSQQRANRKNSVQPGACSHATQNRTLSKRKE